MKTLIVIPARYASTRYPGKPLVGLKGAGGQVKSLVQRSWEAAMAVSGDHRVVVSTDDDRIAKAAQRFGAEVVMTSEACRNGTERCTETLERMGEAFDIIVNLQGDAPLTPPSFVDALIDAMATRPDIDMATPVLQCDGAALNGFLQDRKHGRVGGTTATFRQDRTALYFSKEVIPYVAQRFADTDLTPVWHHVGCYAYRPSALRAYTGWETSPLERLEGLEQLRFLENGATILCVEVQSPGHPFWELNNPEDLPKIEKILHQWFIA